MKSYLEISGLVFNFLLILIILGQVHIRGKRKRDNKRRSDYLLKQYNYPTDVPPIDPIGGRHE